MNWDDVLRAALLGTERAPLPSRPREQGRDVEDLLALIPAVDPETRLLTTAAVLAQYRRAGRPLARRPDRPRPDPAPLDDRRPLGPAAARFLQQMLNGHHADVLPEWLAAAEGRNLKAAPQTIPSLLELGRHPSDVQPLIQAIVGARGAWLAAQNPDWSHAALVAGRSDHELWQTGRRVERVALLRRLRAEDRERARELVRSTWKEDPGEDRAAFVAAFAQELSLDDEPFLEDALDDRRREVRRNAAALLSRLEGSRLVSRMETRLAPLLRLEIDRNGRLPTHLRDRPSFCVDLPERCNEGMTRDGIEARAPGDVRGLGVRAYWLLQMLSAVPPRHHAQRFGCSPLDVARAAASSEFSSLLLGGLEAATIAFGDAETARALIDVLGGLERPVESALYAVLPREDRERRATDALRPPLEDGHPALAILAACDFSWGPALGRAFVRAIRATMSVAAQRTAESRALLGEAGRRFPPSLASTAALGWPPTQPLPHRAWLAAYDAFLSTVMFREKALASLAE